jgi:restriction system protein
MAAPIMQIARRLTGRAPRAPWWWRMAARLLADPAPGSPFAFEDQCRAILAVQGWRAWTTPASGDQGADVVAEKGRARVVLQCKLYRRPVGNKAVQEVFAAAAHHRAGHAAVVCPAGYTPAARAQARPTGVFLMNPHDLLAADRLFPA